MEVCNCNKLGLCLALGIGIGIIGSLIFIGIIVICIKCKGQKKKPNKSVEKREKQKSSLWITFDCDDSKSEMPSEDTKKEYFPEASNVFFDEGVFISQTCF